MILYLQQKLTDHFNKLLLALLFIVIVGLAVHLMHKADAGGDDTQFIGWAENVAFLILGRLLAQMPNDSPGSSNKSENESKGQV